MINLFRGVKPLFPTFHVWFSQTVEDFVASFWTVLLTLYSLVLIAGTVIVALFGWTVIIGGPL